MRLPFENAILFNGNHPEEDTYSKFLVKKCKHMVRYAEWLALEILEVDDSYDFLTMDNHLKCLEERMV